MNENTPRTKPPRAAMAGAERSDRLPIRTQIKHGSYPLDNEEERARVAKLNTHSERLFAFVE